MGLSFSTDVEPSQYLSPTEDFVGVEILIHSSMDFPDNLVSTSVVQSNEDLRISIDPDIIVSDDRIRSMHIQQRNCWFPDEVKLIVTKEYSFEACMFECRAKFAFELCGCMPFFFPQHSKRSKLLSRLMSLTF